MALSIDDHRAILAGFENAGYVCTHAPRSSTNPIQVQWHTKDQARYFRLWSFDITHGGGGPTVRDANEFRIQITNGPSVVADIDKDGIVDLLIGYSRDQRAIVAYDRAWLERWTKKKEDTGTGGSPSVQVRTEDIQEGHNHGIHHLTKSTDFGQRNIVTMNPDLFPTYLLNHDAILRGTVSAHEAQAASSHPNETTVVDYCCSQGFSFSPDIIARYLAALLAKPFVILAGVSGTGKSKLAQLVAEYYGDTHTTTVATTTHHATSDSFVFLPSKRTPDPTRFALVAVRPDWTDDQSILGFVNPITERYESTQALDLVLRAEQMLRAADEKPSAPRYFLLLDEMNLARVEHYFSDWLACTESRRLMSNGSISQQVVPLYRSNKPMKTTIEAPDGSIETLSVPASLALPTNLIVTGTVNVDETTYGFSPKVLDRAMVLELDEVDLEQLRSGRSSVSAGSYRFPASLPPFQLATPSAYAAIPHGAHSHLIAINTILQDARLHFGYRAANEIALFMTYYNRILPDDSTDTEWLRALDAAVLQKYLPRLSGNRARLETPLATLCAYFRDLVHPREDVSLHEFDRAAQASLPKTYGRAVEMLESLRDFGFVSFFK